MAAGGMPHDRPTGLAGTAALLQFSGTGWSTTDPAPIMRRRLNFGCFHSTEAFAHDQDTGHQFWVTIASDCPFPPSGDALAQDGAIIAQPGRFSPSRTRSQWNRKHDTAGPIFERG